MNWTVETFNLTRCFRGASYKRFASFEGSTPASFFQSLVGRLTGNVSIHAVKALDKVNIKVGEGEFFGLLGPNGSGKTTLLKVLAGLLRPTEGTARVLGYDLIKERMEVIKRMNYVAGLLTGGVWCNPNLSARKNLEAVANLYNVPKSRIDGVLEFVGLRHVADSRVGTFSSGMSARLVVALGLLREAPLYLMDEPTIGISAEAAREIHSYLKEHVQGELKCTIIYATNNVVEAEKLCDRVAILNEGRVLVCDSPRELISSLKKSEVVEVKLLNSTPEIVQTLEKQSTIINVSVKEGVAGMLAPMEHVLRIRVYDSEEALPDIINVIAKKFGCEIRHISILKPNLEDVFIQCTTARGVENG